MAARTGEEAGPEEVEVFWTLEKLDMTGRPDEDDGL